MKTLRLLSILFVCALPLTATAQSNFQQDFESFPSLFTGTNPWALVNNSDSPVGGQPWFTGDSTIFAAQAGAGYAAASFFSTGGLTGTETISNWLITPTLNLTTGGTMTFYTKSEGAAANPDRMEVLLSLNGSSANVGATSTSVGDFTTTLASINPLLLSSTAGGYPTTWTQFIVFIPAVATGTTGRIAFHYDVPNSGLNGANGDYIGVDSITSTLTTVPEPSTWALGLTGLGVLGFMVRRRQSARA